MLTMGQRLYYAQGFGRQKLAQYYSRGNSRSQRLGASQGSTACTSQSQDLHPGLSGSSLSHCPASLEEGAIGMECGGTKQSPGEVSFPYKIEAQGPNNTDVTVAL